MPHSTLTFVLFGVKDILVDTSFFYQNCHHNKLISGLIICTTFEVVFKKKKKRERGFIIEKQSFQVEFASAISSQTGGLSVNSQSDSLQISWTEDFWKCMWHLAKMNSKCDTENKATQWRLVILKGVKEITKHEQQTGLRSIKWKRGFLHSLCSYSWLTLTVTFSLKGSNMVTFPCGTRCHIRGLLKGSVSMTDHMNLICW